MRPDQFLKTQLQQQSISPILLFSGEESLWKEIHIDKIKSILNIEKKGPSDCNYRGDTSSLAEVITECESSGFFGGNKIVVLKDLDKVKSADHSLLINYFDNPNPTTTFILTTLKPDRRQKIYSHKLIKKNEVEYNIKHKKDVQNFIRVKLKLLGDLSITSELEHMLMEAFPKNLQALSKNLEKIAAHSNYQSPLSKEHFVVVNLQQEEVKSFDLTDNIFNRNFIKALTLSKELLKNDGSPLPLIGLLRWHFELCLRAKEMANEGHPIPEIQKACRIPPFKAKSFFRQLETYGFQDLQNKYMLLSECDHMLKSSSQNPFHLFEMLLYKLCR